jgi:hypothetical protein
MWLRVSKVNKTVSVTSINVKQPPAIRLFSYKNTICSQGYCSLSPHRVQMNLSVATPEESREFRPRARADGSVRKKIAFLW